MRFSERRERAAELEAEYPSKSAVIHHLLQQLDAAESELEDTRKELSDTIEGIAVIVAERDEFRGQARWVPVDERLPELGDEVFIWGPDLGVVASEFMDIRETPVSWSSATVSVGEWFQDDDLYLTTHWRPIQPPTDYPAEQEG